MIIINEKEKTLKKAVIYKSYSNYVTDIIYCDECIQMDTFTIDDETDN